MSTTALHLVLYGADAAVHEHHTGVPGSFERLLARVDEARGRGATVLVTTPLTRSGFRVLSHLPPLLRARAVAAWCISVPTPEGERPAERLLPRLAMAVPHALHAMERAARLALPAWIRGAPLCLLGPHAARRLPAPALRYGEACRRCEARPVCPGVDAGYLARFGEEELKPRPDRPAPHPEPAALAALLLSTPVEAASPLDPAPA